MPDLSAEAHSRIVRNTQRKSETVLRRATYSMLILVTLAGCRQMLRTESTVTVPHPVTAYVNADLQPNDKGPVRMMLVDGDPRCCTDRIAILDIDGVLLNTNMTMPYSASENPVSVLREKLDAIAQDPCTVAVVLRINSPGGGVAATEMMWHQLRGFRQRVPVPMVACMMDVSTGGAYYLATAADVICGYPGTVTGGIGVILNCYNLQDTMAQYNVLSQSIKAGEHIDMGSALQTMTPAVRECLQAMADEYHQRFKEVVLTRRPQIARDNASTFDGRIFTATQAIERGLIDHLGTLEDAIATARQMSQRENACAVMYHRCTDQARSPYATTANAPTLNNLLPLSLPGLERSRLPTFLYMWEPDPTVERAKAY